MVKHSLKVLFYVLASQIVGNRVDSFSHGKTWDWFFYKVSSYAWCWYKWFVSSLQGLGMLCGSIAKQESWQRVLMVGFIGIQVGFSFNQGLGGSWKRSNSGLVTFSFL